MKRAVSAAALVVVSAWAGMQARQAPQDVARFAFRTSEAQPLRSEPNQSAAYRAVLDVNDLVRVAEDAELTGDFLPVQFGAPPVAGWVEADLLRLDPEEVKQTVANRGIKAATRGIEVSDEMWFGPASGLASTSVSLSAKGTGPAVVFFADKPWAMLNADYQANAAKVPLVVPKGFVTDFASVPRYLRPLVSTSALMAAGSVVHDYLYWVQSSNCPREQADRAQRRLMEAEGVAAYEARAFHLAVRIFGGRAWRDNRRQKTNGWIKLVPPAFATVPPPPQTWRGYRKVLFDKQVHDGVAPAVAPGACPS